MARSKRSKTPTVTASDPSGGQRQSNKIPDPVIHADEYIWSASEESSPDESMQKGGKKQGKKVEGKPKLLQCPLCHPSKKRYKTEAALVMHLESNYHDEEELKSLNTAAQPETSVDVPEEDESPTVAQTIRLIKKATNGPKTDHIDTSFFEDIVPSTRETQMLIICHSRDYATQIEILVREATKDMELQIHMCVGGTSISEDIKALFHGPHIVIGCLGRVGDMLHRRRFRTKHISVLVLDQVSSLLKGGNQDQLALVHRSIEPGVKVVATAIDVSGEGAVGVGKKGKGGDKRAA